MRKINSVVVVAILAVLFLGTGSAAAGQNNRTVVFHTWFKGLVAVATWTTCPHPQVGQLCRDTAVLGFDAVTRENVGGSREAGRGPVLRVLTSVYRVVGGEQGTAPVAEWFGRATDVTVTGTPRLTEATATGTVPVQVCEVVDQSAGVSCPTRLDVAVRWTGIGSLSRIDDHTVTRTQFRLENSWTRGWERAATATGTVGTASLGTLVDGSLTRADQGQVVVQRPV